MPWNKSLIHDFITYICDYIYINILYRYIYDKTGYGIKQASFFGAQISGTRQLLHSLDNKATGDDDEAKPKPPPREPKQKKEPTLAQKAKAALSKASGKLVEGKGWDKALQMNKTQSG